MGLSPNRLKDYIGQERVKENLRIILQSVQGRSVFDDPMDHTLLCGPPGLGKTSLAEIVSNELMRPVIKLMGPQLKDVESLSFLTNIRPWTFVFIDEIHALPIKVEEALYEPIDDHKWQGQSINKFTLIGATTKEGLVSKPLRSRFTIVETLTPYSVSDLTQIISRSATILKVSIDDKAVETIAKRSRGTPRIANQLLKRVSYYSANITHETAQKCLDSLQIAEEGIDAQDYKILSTILKSFNGGPVGIESLSAVANEDATTIESREAFLVESGLVQRSSRGRLLTSKGREVIELRKGLYGNIS